MGRLFLKHFIACVVSVTAMASQADASSMRCVYDGRYFIVVDQGVIYKVYVNSGSRVAQTVCHNSKDLASPVLAALYDGNNFVVYDGNDHKFYSQSVDDDVAKAQLDMDENIVAFTDLNNVFVYDGKAHRFYSRNIDDNSARTNLQVGPGLAAIYDGDDLTVYDTVNGQFTVQTVDDDAVGAILEVGVNVVGFSDLDDVFVYDGEAQKFATPQPIDDKTAATNLLVGNGGVMAYDGDDVFYFCNKSHLWSSDYADDNMRSAGDADMRELFLTLQVNGTFFSLNTDSCQTNTAKL